MSFRVDVREAVKKITGVEKAAEAINKSVYRGINKVAAKTVTRSRREIVSQVTLTQTYIRDRMGVDKATPENATATIYARVRPTRLATYGAKQLTRKTKSGKGKGDAMRKIPAGQKAAGVSVKVKKAGSRKRMPGAFFVPLRAGNVAGGNAMGVFIRVGSGRKDIKHLYSLSVDQLFKGVITRIQPEVEKELHETIAKQMAYEMKQAARTA